MSLTGWMEEMILTQGNISLIRSSQAPDMVFQSMPERVFHCSSARGRHDQLLIHLFGINRDLAVATSSKFSHASGAIL